MRNTPGLFRRSIASIALAGALAPAAAYAAPLSGILHLHPHAAPGDSGVSFTLFNKSIFRREVIVDGKTYIVLPGHLLGITALPGTRVYAGSKTASHDRGSLLVEVTPDMRDKQVSVD